MLYTFAGPTSEREGRRPSDFPHPSDDAFHAFFSHLGQAMAAWAQVEQQILSAYTRTVNAPDHRCSQLSFIIPTSFNIRLQMTDAVVRTLILDEAVMAKWDKLQERARKKSLVRNQLAHGIVLCMLPEVELVIAASVNDPRKDFIHKPLNAKQLVDVRDSFLKLELDLRLFWVEHLSGWPAQDPPPTEPAVQNPRPADTPEQPQPPPQL